MKSIYDLTPEERKQAKPDNIRLLIDLDRQRIKNKYLPTKDKRDLEKEIEFLKDLLSEIEQ